MLTKQTFIRWSTGLLSAGGAFFLAACYGPQRPPHGPPGPSRAIRGVVLHGDTPVEGIAVCEMQLPDRCPLTDAEGRFEVRFISDGSPVRLCTKNALADRPRYTETCIDVAPGVIGVQIPVQPQGE
jgi:hypothetical protein